MTTKLQREWNVCKQTQLENKSLQCCGAGVPWVGITFLAGKTFSRSKPQTICETKASSVHLDLMSQGVEGNVANEFTESLHASTFLAISLP